MFYCSTRNTTSIRQHQHQFILFHSTLTRYSSSTPPMSLGCLDLDTTRRHQTHPALFLGLRRRSSAEPPAAPLSPVSRVHPNPSLSHHKTKIDQKTMNTKPRSRPSKTKSSCQAPFIELIIRDNTKKQHSDSLQNQNQRIHFLTKKSNSTTACVCLHRRRL